MNPLELVLAAVIGGTVGFLAGVFGVGGGFLVVPLLNVLLGVPMPLAAGSGACQMLGPATTALMARRVRPAQLRLPLIVSGGLFIGVLLGAEALETAKTRGTWELNGRAVPVAEVVLLAFYAVLLASLGMFALWETRRSRPESPTPGCIAEWPIPPYAALSECGGGRASIPILGCFGLVVGILSGLLGIGGGVVLLPGLIYLIGMKTHSAILTSLVMVWIVSLQATVVHSWHGNVDLRLVIALLVGGTSGARLGSEVGERLRGPQLRRSFGWLVLLAAVLVAAKLVNLLV